MVRHAFVLCESQHCCFLQHLPQKTLSSQRLCRRAPAPAHKKAARGIVLTCPLPKPPTLLYKDASQYWRRGHCMCLVRTSREACLPASHTPGYVWQPTLAAAGGPLCGAGAFALALDLTMMLLCALVLFLSLYGRLGLPSNSPLSPHACAKAPSGAACVQLLLGCQHLLHCHDLRQAVAGHDGHILHERMSRQHLGSIIKALHRSSDGKLAGRAHSRMPFGSAACQSSCFACICRGPHIMPSCLQNAPAQGRCCPPCWYWKSRSAGWASWERCVRIRSSSSAPGCSRRPPAPPLRGSQGLLGRPAGQHSFSAWD